MIYGDGAATANAAIAIARSQHKGHHTRQVRRTIALVFSIAGPIAFVAYADHIRNTTGIDGVAAAGALVALSLVIAVAVLANR